MRGPDETFRAELRDGLDADARVGTDVPAHLVVQERGETVGLGRARLYLESGVDVLGVLPEDHHVHLFGMEHGRGHPGEPPHRPQAHIEVEQLAQRHVEGPDASSDRRGERALDPDQVCPERFHGLLGEPVARLVERLLPRQHLFPGDLVAVLGGGGVEHEPGGGPDVDAGAVAFDERDDGFGRDSQDTVVAHSDAFSHAREPTGHRSSRATHGDGR